MRIEYSDFQETVRDNAGEILTTSGGRALFQVITTNDGVRFTPVSTGKQRGVRAVDIRRYLVVFNETQSTITSDYRDNFRNASYVPSVIKLWIGQHPDAPLIEFDRQEKARLDPDNAAEEGELKIRLHVQRERSRELVKMAKQIFREKHNGHLYCEVCSFDFEKIYGDPDFIEAHHRVPLHQLEPGTKTKLSDLQMVCANCHRMLHRGVQWPTIESLQKGIRTIRMTYRPSHDESSCNKQRHRVTHADTSKAFRLRSCPPGSDHAAGQQSEVEKCASYAQSCFPSSSF